MDGGGLTRMVGTAGILGTGCWVLGADCCSGFWRTEKTRLKIDRIRNAPLSPHGWVRSNEANNEEVGNALDRMIYATTRTSWISTNDAKHYQTTLSGYTASETTTPSCRR